MSDEARRHLPPDDSAPVAPRPLSILVVDDEPDTGDTLAELLQMSGYAVAVARSGEEATRRLDGADVIFLDLRLPDIDGCELARCVRARNAPKRPLLVAVTGYGRAEDVRRTADAGVDYHLIKPVAPAELLGLLDRYARGAS